MNKQAAEKIASEYYDLGIQLALQGAGLTKTANPLAKALSSLGHPKAGPMSQNIFKRPDSVANDMGDLVKLLKDNDFYGQKVKGFTRNPNYKGPMSQNTDSVFKLQDSPAGDISEAMRLYKELGLLN